MALCRDTIDLSPVQTAAILLFSSTIPETRTSWEPSPEPRNSFRGLAHLTRISVKIIFPTQAPLTGFRPTAMKSAALSRGTLCPTETPGVYENHETAEVTGGTGRFAHATGHFDLTRATRLHHEPALVFCPVARDDQASSGTEKAVEIVRLICASQLAFV